MNSYTKSKILIACYTLKYQYGISKKDNLRDRFSSEEIARIDRLEDTAGSLMRLGFGYEEIKDFIMSDRVKNLIG